MPRQTRLHRTLTELMEAPAQPWRGEGVVMRRYGNAPAPMRVWDVADGIVGVVSERNYWLLVEQRAGAVLPIGQRLGDVYVLDQETRVLIDDWERSPEVPFPWEQLRPWHPVRQDS